MPIPRNFGKTGVCISALGFGGNHLGAGRDEKAAIILAPRSESSDGHSRRRCRVRPSFNGPIQLSPHLYLNLLCTEHRDRNRHLAHFSHEFSCRLISHFMQAGRQEA
jgi:hypothetical protein